MLMFFSFVSLHRGFENGWIEHGGGGGLCCQLLKWIISPLPCSRDLKVGNIVTGNNRIRIRDPIVSDIAYCLCSHN
jgi:hypothetical protein